MPSETKTGPMPNSTWPKPYILFYAVSSPTLTRWVDVSVPEDIGWQQSKSDNLLNTLNATQTSPKKRQRKKTSPGIQIKKPVSNDEISKQLKTLVEKVKTVKRNNRKTQRKQTIVNENTSLDEISNKREDKLNEDIARERVDDYDEVNFTCVKTVYTVDLSKVLGLEEVSALKKLGTVHGIKGDGNCGFRSIMENLIAKRLLDQKCTVTEFRRGMYDFASNINHAETRIEDRTVDHTHSRLQANRKWVKKVFRRGINFDKGIGMKYWFDTQPMMGVLALQYSRTLSVTGSTMDTMHSHACGFMKK